MPPSGFHLVTGAFGYSGRYLAQRLLAAGHEVRTLTNSPQRANPFGGRVPAFPFHFDQPQRLVETMRGAAVLYNTYWVRFNYRAKAAASPRPATDHGPVAEQPPAPAFTHADAVANTLALFRAAQEAGVGRVVHVSITNPAEDSPLEYFAGKARLERALRASGLPHTILRPTVLFGKEDILVNNIAWALRRFPVFGVFGAGQYRLQPIYVDDLAALAVAAGVDTQDRTIDAIGPETFTYRELVARLGQIIGRPRKIVCVPPALAYLATRAAGWFVHDVVITREEIAGLMAGLLCTTSPPAGPTRLTDWATAHAATLGRRYASELARRKDRTAEYARV